MWSFGRRALQDLLSLSAVRSFSLTPAQNTVVVERWWQVPLSKRGSPPRLHPRRHKIYKFVEDTKQAPQVKMALILTQTVPKLGGRGDTVLVKKSIGRNKLLPQGLAVYPSPENKQIFAEELRLLREGKPEDRLQTRTGLLTLDYLKNFKLKMRKMPSAQFQITKEVVCRLFLKKGIVVPPHAVNFPFEMVNDVGDYWCEVTINGIDKVQVPLSVTPYKDLSMRYQQQLANVQQDDPDISESTDVDKVSVKSVSEASENSVNPADKIPISEEEQRSGNTSTSSDAPKQD